MVDFNGAKLGDFIEFGVHLLLIFAFSLIFYPHWLISFIILLFFGLILQDCCWLFHSFYKNKDIFKKDKHFCHKVAFYVCVGFGIAGVIYSEPFLVAIGVLGVLHALVDFFGRKIGGGSYGKPKPQIVPNFIGS